MSQAPARDLPGTAAGMPAAVADPAALIAANVNPATGLSTDYLNHFNEAIMLLEMLPAMPECQEDFAAWRPLGYRAHFERSRLAHSDLAIAAYEQADAGRRAAFDALCAAMREAVLAAQAAIAEDPGEAAILILAEDTTARLKRMAARAGVMIHGHDPVADAGSIQESQAAIDALLQP